MVLCLFFFKQKTAYEMRISDWSSDVCSSDVSCPVFFGAAAIAPDFVTFIFGPKWTEGSYIMIALALVAGPATLNYFQGPALFAAGRSGDRKSVGEGKRVAVRVDLGGRRFLKKKKNNRK